MKSALQIIAAINHPEFVEYRVEKLANAHNDLGYSKQQVPSNYEAIETSTAGVHVSGIVAIEASWKRLNITFITGFVFTCIKGHDNVYKLTWSSSLS